MKIIKSNNAKGMVITLKGRLDTNTAPELETFLEKDLETLNTLTLELMELTYISSAGLRVILSLHKALSKRNGLYIAHPREEVLEVFDMTGFSSFLNIEE